MNMAKELLLILVTAIVTSGWWATVYWFDLHHGLAILPCIFVTVMGAVIFLASHWDDK